MDTSSLIVVVTPITTLIALVTSITLPFIAASRPERSHAKGRLATANAQEAGQRRTGEGPAAGMQH